MTWFALKIFPLPHSYSENTHTHTHKHTHTHARTHTHTNTHKQPLVTALTFPTYCFPVPVHSSKRKKLFHIHPRLVRCRLRPSRSDVLIPGTGRISALLQPSKQNNRRKLSWLIIIVSDHSWRVLDKESIKKQSPALKILLNGVSDEMGHLILNSPKFCLLGACDG